VRLVTWNCAGGFTNKWSALLSLEPDIAIIQECSSRTEVEAMDLGWEAAWCGRVPKGMAVIARPGITVARLAQTFQWTLPFRVTGDAEMEAIAIWALSPGDTKHSYGRQGLLAVAELDQLPDCAWVAGDFNSWDHPAHLEMIDQMRRRGFVSAYHAYRGVARNVELEPTFFQYRHRDKPFHIDLQFVPTTWTIKSVEVGTFDDYVATGLSDHVPVVVTVDP